MRNGLVDGVLYEYNYMNITKLKIIPPCLQEAENIFFVLLFFNNLWLIFNL